MKIRSWSLQAIVVLLALMAWCIQAAAEQEAPLCRKLDQPLSGDAVKYSMAAQVHGPVFFADLACGVKFRNRELCAMEMISFDLSAKVYDYDTLEEIKMNAAFFVVPEVKDDEPSRPVAAFASREAATRFVGKKGTGKVLDYEELLQWVRK